MNVIENKRSAAIPVRHDEEYCAVIRHRYGSDYSLAKAWAPARQPYIAANIERAVESSVPTLVQFVMTYGTETIRKLLIAHAAQCIRLSGAESLINESDLRAIADGIVNSSNPNVRLLTFASIVTFFYRLATGEIEIKFFKVYDIMRAFQKYAAVARQSEINMRLKVKEREKEKAAESVSAETISWEEFAASKGITARSAGEYAMNQGKTINL